MEMEGRTEKSIINIICGIISQLILTIVPFITRTVFIKVLGASYLGVNSLYSSILSVLSLAELGIGNIVVYSLYRPLAEHDNEKIASLVKFYKKIYTVIAAVVLAIGLLILPFLQYIIKLPSDINNLKLYYILFLVNSVISYLYRYKCSIINADQKQYIVSIYTMVVMLLQNFVQIAEILIYKNFLGYLLIQLVFTFILNFSLSKKADSIYKLNLKQAKELDKVEKDNIFNDTKAMLLYRLGSTFLNSTDSIYISTLISTITVGLYANYVTLEGILNKYINLIYDAVYASVGNLNASENLKKRKMFFDVLCLVFFVIGTICITGFYTVASDLIEIWIGKEYCVDKFTVMAIAIRFYMPVILYPIWMYRNTTGLFKETQNILIYAGVLNLVLSFVLGKLIGLSGIIFATSISRLLTSFWYEPYILYKKIFNDNNAFEYYIQVVFSVCVTIASIYIIMYISKFLMTNILTLLIKMSLSVIIPIICYLFIYSKSNQFKYLKSLIISKVCKKFWIHKT